MGYIGLLLNAPYKIDSMMWIMIGFDLIVPALVYIYVYWG
jgi:hypothetical protein